MSDDTPSLRNSGGIERRGYQPQISQVPPTTPASGVQGGYQPATGQQAPTPPNEGSGVQQPAKSR
jgi:hypothetical protein